MNENPEKKSNISNSSSKKTEDLKEIFDKVRNRWAESINTHLSSFNDVEQLALMQPAVLRDRQILIEQKHKIQENYERLNKTLKENMRNLYLNYNNSDIKKSYQAIILLVEGDTAELKERMEVISNHILFLEDTLKTIDHIIYGINYRVRMEEYR